MVKKWWIFERTPIESLQYWKAERRSFVFLLICIATLFPLAGILHWFQSGMDSASVLLLVTVAFLVPMTGLSLSNCNHKIKELSRDSEI